MNYNRDTINNRVSAARPSLKDDNVVRYIFTFTISLAVVLVLLANFGGIANLMSNVSYIVNPSKKYDDNERLTKELIALYGSGQLPYYQSASNNLPVTAQVQQSAPQQPAFNQPANAAAQPAVSSGVGQNQDNYLYIPDINISAPIVAGTTTDEKTILNQLTKGVVMYPGSAGPGRTGQTVIIGHSSSYKPWENYAHVFSKLPNLTKGDMIIINYGGKKYSYRVEAKLTGSVNELSKMNITNDLVLGTCWPIGTNEKRVLITANLESVN